MYRLTGAVAASLMLTLAPASALAQKGVPNYYGPVDHQKTGTTNHPGGHSSVYGHKKNAGSGGYYQSGGYSSGSSCGKCGSKPKPKPVLRCFPPGHCKSINQGYYGPPGQKGR